MSEFQRRLEANIRESLRFAVGEVQDDAVAHMVAGVNAVLNHPCAPAPSEHVAGQFDGTIDSDSPLQAAAREAGWALTTLVDISDWQRRDQISAIIARLASALLDADCSAPLQHVAGINLTLTRALGIYGAAYDPIGVALRAYTYEHQPGNGVAWNLGCAVSALRHHPTAGDPIDVGLYLLKEMQARGLGVFEVEPKAVEPAPEKQAEVGP